MCFTVKEVLKPSSSSSWPPCNRPLLQLQGGSVDCAVLHECVVCVRKWWRMDLDKSTAKMWYLFHIDNAQNWNVNRWHYLHWTDKEKLFISWFQLYQYVKFYIFFSFSKYLLPKCQAGPILLYTYWVTWKYLHHDWA